MKKDQVRIIFYGTAPFATACLERLVDEGYPIVAVVTAPDYLYYSRQTYETKLSSSNSRS